MEKTKDGFSVFNPASDGGFASIGNGASRAFPAGKWVLDSPVFFPSSPVDSAGQEIDGARIPISRIPRPLPIATGRTGTGGSTKPLAPDPTTPAAPTAPTDSQSLIDLFKSMFGASSATNKPADTGAVVVYGDAAGGAAPAMSPIVKLLIAGGLIGGGVWAWKKYA